MSITETDVVFVEPPNRPFPDAHSNALDWFSPLYLRAANPHPLDRTIQYTGDRTFFVKWFEHASDHPHDDTVSVTQLVASGNHRAASSLTLVDLDERRQRGTDLHRYIECVLNGFPLLCATPVQRQFTAYYHDHIHGTLVPLRTEMAIRSSSALRVVGVVDALFVDLVPTGPSDGSDGSLRVHLRDWKYSSGCLREYTQQLNWYKFLLESAYGERPFQYAGQTFHSIAVVSMEVVTFHESLSTYARHVVPETPADIVASLILREKQITSAPNKNDQ